MLRLLLECYCHEKKVRHFILQKLFDEQPKIGKGSRATLCFDSLKSIVTQFDPKTNEFECAALYREAWTSGNGIVNLDSFLVAANER